MPRIRTAGTLVSGSRTPLQLQARWGRTSGAGAPTLQSNLGTASITDAGTGLMDVTFETPIINGTVSDTTAPTATAIRLNATSGTTPASGDPAVGYCFAVWGGV